MFAISTKEVDDSKGILYVLEIELEDKLLVKIGFTQRTKVEDRVVEILTSIWKKYRIFPKTYVKRFSTFEDVVSKEQELLKKFEEYRYSTKYKFSGSTEIFDLELDKVVEAYDALEGRVKGGK